MRCLRSRAGQISDTRTAEWNPPLLLHLVPAPNVYRLVSRPNRPLGASSHSSTYNYFVDLQHRPPVSCWPFSRLARKWRTMHAPRPQFARQQTMGRKLSNTFSVKACCVRFVDSSQGASTPPEDAPLACVCLMKCDQTERAKTWRGKGTDCARLAQPKGC